MNMARARLRMANWTTISGAITATLTACNCSVSENWGSPGTFDFLSFS